MLAALWNAALALAGIAYFWLMLQFVSSGKGGLNELAPGVAMVLCAAAGLCAATLRRCPGWHNLARAAAALLNSAGGLYVFDAMVADGLGKAFVLLLVAPMAMNAMLALAGVTPRRAAHLCRACGYDLRGTDGDVCPECGDAPA